MRIAAWIVVLLIVVTSGLTWFGHRLDRETMRWGALIRPFALETQASRAMFDVAESIRAQFDLVEQLGLNTVRMSLEANWGLNDTMIDEANRRGLAVVLILEDTAFDGLRYNDRTTDFYARGKSLGERAGQRWHGRIRYYQLANEVSGSAARQNGDTGPTLPNRFNLSYDAARYGNVRDYVKGIADGLKATDHAAKRIVTGHWVLVDIFPALIRDGVDFDIIGWDWYSDMGTDPARYRTDEGNALDFPAFADRLGKEFWLAEVNREAGSFDGTEQAQADWLSDLGQTVLSNRQITGAMIHLLPDMAEEVRTNQKTGSLGLVPVRFDQRGFARFTTPKPAFTAYQKLITRRSLIEPDRQPVLLERLSLTVAHTLDRLVARGWPAR